MRKFASLLLCSIAIISSSAALACGNGKLLFEEKFAQRPAFIAEDAAIKYGDGTMVETRSQPNLAWWSWQPNPNRDYEVCVKVSASADKIEKGSPVAGVVFFVYNTEHFATVFLNNVGGNFQVAMRTGNGWHTLIPWVSHTAINRGPTAENQISVSTRGNFALIRINGISVAELNLPVAAVDGKTWAGFGRQTAPEGTSTFRIKDYQIREAIWK